MNKHNIGEGKVNLPALSQVGVVVKDLDKTIEFYSSTFGIGPWRVVEFDNPEVNVRGKHYRLKVKVGFAQLGSVELELIQVLDGWSVHSEFLEEGWEGLHHLQFRVTEDEMDYIIAELEKEGIGIIQSAKGKIHAGRFAYLDIGEIGGVIFELSSRPPE